MTGCDVVEAADGRDALTKALVRPPALVLTEIVLPFVDGIALCAILRNDRTTAQVPIVVVTADSRLTQVERARAAGADLVFIKPTPIDTLTTAVRQLMASVATDRLAARAVRPLAAKSTIRIRTTLSKSYERFTTTTPPTAPPALTCPRCDRLLEYEQSHIGGVNARNREQWDMFVCPVCGAFQYRHRTRRLVPQSR
jgi:CheY-like chemotaxis protein/uncharacterized C2H2 Zn-finger protein